MWLFNQLNMEVVKQRYSEEFGDKAEQMLQEHREEIWKGKVFADVGENNWKQLGFESFKFEEVYLDVLMQMGLTICECHRNSFFLTSDNPVILTAQSQKNSPGLGLRDAEIWFPISWRKGLLWSWRHKGIAEKISILGHSATRMRNRNMIKWCYKEVYSPLPDDWIKDAVKEIAFDPCFGHYGSLKEMAEAHSLPAVDENNREMGDIIDMVAALRAGEKKDVVKLHHNRSVRPPQAGGW